jgi:hypothetical protein
MGLFLVVLGVVGLGLFVRAAAPSFIPALSGVPERAETLRAGLAEDLDGQITADGAVRCTVDGRTLFIVVEERGDREHIALVVKVRDVVEPGARVELRAPIHAIAGDPRAAFRVQTTDGDRLKRLLAPDPVVDVLRVLISDGQETVVVIDEAGHLQVLADDVGTYRDGLLQYLGLIVALARALAGEPT